MKEIKYFEVVDGKILGFFPKMEDGKYKITEIKRMRSPKQNRLYWGYIIKYIVLKYKEIGVIHTKDFIHKRLKKAFIQKIRVYSDFSKKYVLKSGTTTNMNTKQFTEFIDNIKILCEFGKLDEIPELEYLEPFVIPDITEEELLQWIDKIV